ncbi:MAG: saccharopine dehydrogenase NADP-binding domain-containing protein [Candidatus Freyrarchaeum guaymaensis]
MNILVLGGAGYMGSEIANQLVKRCDAEITISDIDSKGLNKVATKLGDRVTTRVINVNDLNDLVLLMKSSDIVVSAIGPFYKYGVKIVKACIQAGVNFVDINDDYDATQEVLSLDEEAKKAGVTAVIGLGASPGFTNMLAKYGADKLDKVQDIHIFWSESSVDPTGRAAMEHWFHIIAGEVPMFKDGKWVNVKGLSDPEVIEFHSPIGSLEVYYTGHPEPVTLPRYIKGVKNVTIKGGLYPPSIMRVWKVLTEVGFGSKEDFRIKDDLSMPLRELLVRLLRAMPHFAPEFFNELYTQATEKYQGYAGAIKVEVIGEKQGEKMQYTYDTVSDSVRLGTAIPAALGTIMILRGEVKVDGVLAPEGAIDSKMFISEIKNETKIYEKCVRIKTL